jgi:hypothetical protein
LAVVPPLDVLERAGRLERDADVEHGVELLADRLVEARDRLEAEAVGAEGAAGGRRRQPGARGEREAERGLLVVEEAVLHVHRDVADAGGVVFRAAERAEDHREVHADPEVADGVGTDGVELEQVGDDVDGGAVAGGVLQRRQGVGRHAAGREAALTEVGVDGAQELVGVHRGAEGLDVEVGRGAAGHGVLSPRRGGQQREREDHRGHP